VDGFSPTARGGLLAVTTQVAEMSLDLDADLLVTELAPVPALIQRLGRLNRRVSEENHGTPRLALVIPPEKELPYEADDLATAEAWIDRLANVREASQRDLADHFLALSDERPPRLKLETEWLDSGWCAWPGKIRDAGFSVNVILPKDADACRRSGQEIIKRSLPMPYHSRMEAWPMLRGAFIAPPDAIQYDDRKGATWAD